MTDATPHEFKPGDRVRYTGGPSSDREGRFGRVLGKPSYSFGLIAVEFDDGRIYEAYPTSLTLIERDPARVLLQRILDDAKGSASSNSMTVPADLLDEVRTFLAYLHN